jgi:monoamine oxidase
MTRKKVGKMPSLVGFFSAKETREYHGKPEDRKRAVIQQLFQIFGSDDADYVDYIDKDWAEEQWSDGCFYGIMSLGVLSVFGSVLRQPFQRIHFAGNRNCSKMAVYFESAIESGLRAATEIEQRMKQCKL